MHYKGWGTTLKLCFHILIAAILLSGVSYAADEEGEPHTSFGGRGSAADDAALAGHIKNTIPQNNDVQPQPDGGNSQRSLGGAIPGNFQTIAGLSSTLQGLYPGKYPQLPAEQIHSAALRIRQAIEPQEGLASTLAAVTLLKNAGILPAIMKAEGQNSADKLAFALCLKDGDPKEYPKLLSAFNQALTSVGAGSGDYGGGSALAKPLNEPVKSEPATTDAGSGPDIRPAPAPAFSTAGEERKSSPVINLGPSASHGRSPVTDPITGNDLQSNLDTPTWGGCQGFGNGVPGNNNQFGNNGLANNNNGQGNPNGGGPSGGGGGGGQMPMIPPGQIPPGNIPAIPGGKMPMPGPFAGLVLPGGAGNEPFIVKYVPLDAGTMVPLDLSFVQRNIDALMAKVGSIVYPQWQGPRQPFSQPLNPYALGNFPNSQRGRGPIQNAARVPGNVR